MRRALWMFLAAAALAAWLLYQLRLPYRGHSGEVLVEIEAGTPARDIAARLEQAGVLEKRWPFLAWHYLHLMAPAPRRTLKAGEYQFAGGLSPRQVYEKLARGDIFYHTLTIPEGYNVFEVAEAVGRTGLVSRQEFLKAVKNTALVADLAPNAGTLEGFLFPDTYQFPRRVTARDIAAALVARFRQVYAELVKKNGPPRLPMLDLVTMASLVEKETGVASERPLVAGVYYNRLAADLPLQCDPTVVYAALLEGHYRGTIYQSDLGRASPYNTYLNRGLPPGPIANPGRASLEAALEPAQTDYLYFVSDARGGHVFSRTLAEHQRHVEAYRRKTNGRAGPRKG